MRPPVRFIRWPERVIRMGRDDGKRGPVRLGNYLVHPGTGVAQLVPPEQRKP